MSRRPDRSHPGVPSLGDPAPGFALATPWGVAVSLHACLRNGPVLVEFVRGTWDPNTRARLDELSALRASIGPSPRAVDSVRVLAVSCERAESARRLLEAAPTSVSYLIDAQREIAKSYGVYRRFSFGAVRVARPASFVIDPCGFVRFARVAASPIDATPVDDLANAIARLDARPKGRDATRDD